MNAGITLNKDVKRDPGHAYMIWEVGGSVERKRGCKHE
jgi:hypothetical protein